MTTLREAGQQALEKVQEFKRRWLLVPAFGNKVNKTTREAITNAHSPIFELEHALRAALSQQAEPAGYRCELCGMANMHEVDALLAEVERLRAQVARLREVCVLREALGDKK